MLRKLLAGALALAVAAACMAACAKEKKNEISTEPEGKPTEPTPTEVPQTTAAPTETEPTETKPTETEVAETEPPKDAKGNIIKAAVSEGPIDPKAGPTENMLLRSLRYGGDSSRIAQKLERAVHYYGEAPTTRIAFLGDSITAGSSATPKNQYPYQVISWWKENISPSVEYINAGIGATDSYLAVHRVDTDVLEKDPDIIFIEFINDSDNSFYQGTMESLVRKCLAHPTNPAVILVEMTMEDGTCPQKVHSQVGEFYDIPILSYRDAVLPEVMAGNMTWREISPDNIHPNNTGHVLLGWLLTDYLQGIFDDLEELPKEVKAFDPASESLSGDKYAQAALYGPEAQEIQVTQSEGLITKSSNDRYRDGWVLENGGSVTFQMEFQNLGILFQKTVDGKSGIATVTVDGSRSYKYQADFTGGWGSYAANSEIVSFEEKGEHTVTVTVPEGKRFEILRWMIS